MLLIYQITQLHINISNLFLNINNSITLFVVLHILKVRNGNEGKIMNDNVNEYLMLNQLPLGMAYVPMQDFTNLYENLEEAFECGTIFRELYKPFTGRRCVR